MFGLDVNVLLGRTLSAIHRSADWDELVFVEEGTGTKWILYHDQDCCESVLIDDIIGDLDDLVGSPLVEAEEATNIQEPLSLLQGVDSTKEKSDLSYGEGSFTWTFYRFRTAKGSVVIRWYGSSNGYYSESVDFRELP